MRVYKGGAYTLGRSSETSNLYSEEEASMDTLTGFSPQDTTGFIAINAIRLKKVCSSVSRLTRLELMCVVIVWPPEDRRGYPTEQVNLGLFSSSLAVPMPRGRGNMLENVPRDKSWRFGSGRTRAPRGLDVAPCVLSMVNPKVLFAEYPPDAERVAFRIPSSVDGYLVRQVMNEVVPEGFGFPRPPP